MSRLLVHTTMSLNGFIAGPNDEMDWAFEHAGAIPAALIDEVVARTGAILGGRRGYEVSRRAERRETSKPFGGRWSRPIFGLTHKPPEDETDPAYHFLSSDVRDAVATASAAAQGRDVLVLGANVVDQCLRERLVAAQSGTTLWTEDHELNCEAAPKLPPYGRLFAMEIDAPATLAVATQVYLEWESDAQPYPGRGLDPPRPASPGPPPAARVRPAASPVPALHGGLAVLEHVL